MTVALPSTILPHVWGRCPNGAEGDCDASPSAIWLNLGDDHCKLAEESEDIARLANSDDPVLVSAATKRLVALQAYMPRDSSGGDHDEMASIVAEMLKKLRLTRIAAGVGP